jgi:hypothetical protein
MRRLVLVLGLSVAVLFASSPAQAQCGVERWSVKTGTDPAAPSINLGTYISTNIFNMQSSTRPASLPANGRVAPRETNQYRITGTLTKYKRETDSDYHLVIQDGSGRTIIVEIPSINCVGGGSPFGTGIRNARSQFDAKLTATTSFKTVSAPVAIRGIGFWDFLHGQTGVAPNGIEIHPVLDIAFTGPIVMNDPAMVSAQATHAPAVLPSDMIEDDDGGRVHVWRGGDPLGDVLHHGGGVIEHPRLFVVFAGDGWDGKTRASALAAVRAIPLDARFRGLERYGVQTAAVTLDGSRVLETAGEPANDLDVQRLLADAVSSGRLQHLDESAIVVVVVPDDSRLAVGATTNWTSYHSLFHPTELAMPYVVVRAGADLREAMFSSIVRAIIDPQGDGWF